MTGTWRTFGQDAKTSNFLCFWSRSCFMISICKWRQSEWLLDLLAEQGKDLEDFFNSTEGKWSHCLFQVLHWTESLQCNTVEQSQWFGEYKLLNLWALKWKEYVWSVPACKQLQFTSLSSVFENQLASGNSPILSHTLSLLLLCRKVSDQLGEGMGCRDYRQTETKIGGASWVNLLWEIWHKRLQTMVVVW